MLGIISAAQNYGQKKAIIDPHGVFTYADILEASFDLAQVLLSTRKDLNEERVAFMVDPGFEYVRTQWAIWRAGGIAVPLCLTHPFPSLQYVLEDTGASIIVVSPAYEKVLETYAQEKGICLIVLSNLPKAVLGDLPRIEVDRSALILYTSGTTNKPKGVVLTHANIESQITTLVKAWEWTEVDYTLCVLPLHHVHGIVNVVCCSLWSGATLEFLPGFSTEQIFNLFLKGSINVFMAVPTIYFKLIAYWESLSVTEQSEITQVLSKFRLMVCGSAALPVSVLERWQTISGHILLERYGMTEIGMAISNPLNGERRAGYVGLPLPGVGVRLVDDKGNALGDNEPGEIQIKGPNVFKEYWMNPNATAKEFTEDGWFKTGDVAIFENGYYRIMGRTSVDIIKSGGYKISALEIEEVLRTHESISDCAVVGIPNEEWGELIVSALMITAEIDLKQLDKWLRERMAAYKTPRQYLIVEELPRNAMGKVVKNDVKKLFAL